MKKLSFIYLLFFGSFAFILFCDNAQINYGHGYASSGDGLCGNCHSPSANGSVSILGVPSVIEAGKSYNLTIRVTRNSSDNPKCGFQMSILKSDGTSAGQYSDYLSDTEPELHSRCQNTNPDSDNDCDNGPLIEYFEHVENINDPGLSFGTNNQISRPVTWTAPSETGTVTFTIGAVLTDGFGGIDQDGDRYTSQIFTRQVSYPPVSVSISKLDVLCFGDDDGAAFATSTGGNGTYSYLWSNGETGSDIINLTAGTYTVTVTSGAGLTGTASVQITQPASMILNAAPTGTTCPGGNNGSVILSISGGASPFSYQWSNGATTKNILNVNAGSYSVTVTDANGCTKITFTTVSSPLALNLPATVNNISCFGLNNGVVNLTPGGGTPPYSYLWTNGATTQDISNLPPGAYTITVTDSKGCSKSSSSVVNEPAVLVLNDTVTNITCFGLGNGSINLVPSGGSPGYTYLWSNDSTTQDIANLPAGTYSVIVTDMNNCTKTDTLTLTQPSAVALSASVSNATCFGLNNGSIDVTPDGGSPGYTYLWSNDSTTQDIANLLAGTYSVIVTDMNNCTKTDTLTLAQPSAITLSASVSNATCFGLDNGSIDLTPGGGSPGYTYLWSNDSTTQDIANLPAGTYSVIVTDMNNCTKTDTITLAQPSAVTLSASVSNATCFGLNNGSIDLTPGGGTSGYTYLWSNDSTTQDIANLLAGTYSVIVTDMNNCTKTDTLTLAQPSAVTLSASVSNATCFGLDNGSIDLTPGGGTPGYTYLWSNGATTQDIAGLASGIYSVTVTDLNNCTKSMNFTVVQPTPLSLTFTILNVTCFGFSNGSINLTSGGGAAGYSYLWSNGATTQDISGLQAGTYSVTLTDVNSCTNTSTVTVMQPMPLSLLFSPSDASCFGVNDGSVALEAGGGTSDYSYLWSNGSTEQNIESLAAGVYIVTVTDANQCTATGSATVIQPSDIDLDAVVSIASCFGGNDGSIDLAVGGGAQGYTYIWSNGFATEDIANLIAGSYSVTVTDITGCVKDETFVMGEAPPLLLKPTIINISCFASPTGGILLEASGGTSPYSYLWSNGDTTQNLSGLSVGSYSVTVTDNNNCSASISGSIVQAPPISLSLTPEPVDCFGATSGNVTATVIGGAGVYDFLWSDGAISQNLIGVPAGLYICTVTDAAGCTTVDSATVEQPLSDLSVMIDSIIPALAGDSNGSIFITVNGATPPYNYVWTESGSGDIKSNEEDLSGVTAGTFNLLVIDANGCQVSLEVIPVPTPVKGVDIDSAIRFYPNPNDGRFVIMVKSVAYSEIFVRIVDAWGKEYYNRRLASEDLNNGHYVDIEGPPSGVYILQVDSPGSILGRSLFVVFRK